MSGKTSSGAVSTPASEVTNSKKTLLMQHESKSNSLNQTFGVTVYETPEGGYTYRVHSRTYEGIRVRDSWSSEHVALEALTIESAGREAIKKFKDWTKAMGAQA